MIRAALVGAAGRMGQAIIAAAPSAGIAITAALGAPGSAKLGCDAGELAQQPKLGIVLTADLHAALARCDVVLDFSTAAALGAHLAACRNAGRALLVGTTGHGASVEALFHAASREIPLLVAPNASLAVTLLLELTRSAAAALPAIDFDVEILEAHHRQKADAPSGTALALGQAVAQARGEVLCVAERGARRRAGEIGFAVMRAGDLVGEHQVLFAGTGEQLLLAHRASERGVFARGALRAAAWLAVQPAGLYAMRDILLSKTAS